MSEPKHILSTAVVVLKESKILLIKSPKRGWEIPGAQVEEGESITHAAIREVEEESGIDVEIIKFCGTFQNVNRGITCFLLLTKPLHIYSTLMQSGFLHHLTEYWIRTYDHFHPKDDRYLAHPKA